MPRLPINYERAVIYKIVCLDISVTQTYVGSTTHLINRRASHKESCTNLKSKLYNQFVYQFIRDNGGFDNWDIVLIENVVGCSDSPTLHARERYWIETLHAELNKNIPTRTRNEYREANKELIAERTKKYEELNKDNIKKYQAKYRELNQAKIIIKNEKYNKKMRELRAMKKLASN